MINALFRSNWCIITGGPSSGKKSVIRLLKTMGYRVVSEVARGVIGRANRQGISTEELRKNEAEFQESLLPIKLKLEQNLSRKEIIFWNRGMPDSYAYLQNCGGDPRRALCLCERGLYKRVFLLEPLPRFVKDYARTENHKVARKLSQLLKEAYEMFGYEVISVPVMPVEERAKFILAQMPDFRVGVLSSGWDEVAWQLAEEISKNFKIAFTCLSREEGETKFGDMMIRNVRLAGIPLITFSSLKFKPWLRKLGRQLERSLGHSFLTDFWRHLHDRELMKLLPPADLIVLVGYMWWFAKEMCHKKNAINLHPALPTGPKGTYRDVIWQLIKEKAKETGVMMHLVTPEVDRGPVIAFCRFPIRGGDFDPLWQEMEKRLKKKSLEKIAKKEGEDNPLFRLIRQRGVIREFPMVIRTIKALQEGEIRIENGRVIDSKDRALEDGYDLTEEIDAVVKEKI